MANRKDFKNEDIASAFISAMNAPDPAPAPKKPAQKKAQAKPDFTPPKGWKLVKEARSERIQLLVRPTTREQLKAEADKAGQSLNEYVNNILEDYLRKGGN